MWNCHKKKKIPPTLTWMPEQFVDHLQLVERSERSAVSGWNRVVNKIHFSKIENYSNHPEFVPLMCEHMLYLTHRQPSAVKKKKKELPYLKDYYQVFRHILWPQWSETTGGRWMSLVEVVIPAKNFMFGEQLLQVSNKVFLTAYFRVFEMFR